MITKIFNAVLPVKSEYKIQELGPNDGVVFTADVTHDVRIAWTRSELDQADRTYITLATFFGRKRQRRYIRHVLGYVMDFDTPEGTTVEEILDRYHMAKLPAPELIIRTATPGHYQAFTLFESPVRIRHDLMLAIVGRIHTLMAEKLGADPQAVGPERLVRRPTKENIAYRDDFNATSWEELHKWYEAYRPMQPKELKKKVVYINRLLDTPAGQHIQKPLAVRGERNEWAYGLALTLYDANIPAEEIRERLYQWNKSLSEPLRPGRIEIILRSVLSGHHHASSRVLERITGREAKIRGWYKFAKSRERRKRNHLSEIREDVLKDLWQYKEIRETQKAWAIRLGVSYRTFKLVLAGLREEGILEAQVGRGRYASSVYSLSQAYIEQVTPAFAMVAAGAEGIAFPPNFAEENSKGHTAISPLKGLFLPFPFAPP